MPMKPFCGFIENGCPHSWREVQEAHSHITINQLAPCHDTIHRTHKPVVQQEPCQPSERQRRCWFWVEAED
jgi:hypothetical protein